MTMNPRTGRRTTPAALLILLAVTGCDKPPDTRDQRLVDLAKESLNRQSEQNRLMAEQSKAIVEESQKLAEATKELVVHDSKARKELVASHAALAAQLDRQRAAIDAGRDQLERERRKIAGQRHRDPLIAVAIQNVGLMIACVLPLVVCLFVLRQMNRTEPDDRAVAELLVHELTTDKPLLLTGPSIKPPALERQVSIDGDVDEPSSNGQSDTHALPS